MLVTLDADFTAPVFTAAPDREVTVLIKANTVFNLKFTVEDNREIDYVTVNVDGVQGFPIRIEGEGKNKVEFAQALSLADHVVLTDIYAAREQNTIGISSLDLLKERV